eukprot:7289890-Prymnesium_polylepis.2
MHAHGRAHARPQPAEGCEARTLVEGGAAVATGGTLWRHERDVQLGTGEVGADPIAALASSGGLRAALKLVERRRGVELVQHACRERLRVGRSRPEHFGRHGARERQCGGQEGEALVKKDRLVDAVCLCLAAAHFVHVERNIVDGTSPDALPRRVVLQPAGHH